MANSDVAIIGGGVIGLSVARELRRAGVERVTVFEREDSIGRGSSSRANGGIRAQFTSTANIEFSMYSITEVERLRDAGGSELSFHQTGYLFMTGDPAAADRLRAGYDLQRSLGIDTEWLDADGILERAPFIRGDGLVAGTFHSRDGYLDPHGLITAYEQDVRKLGAEIRTNSAVEAIGQIGDDFILRVANEEHRARNVVNAAGAHARTIARLLGADVPVDPVRRNLAYLHDAREPKDPIPMCVDLDTGVLVRREGYEGYLVAYSDPNDPPGWDTSLDPSFLDAVAARIGNRFPHLEARPIHPKHCWAGLYPETPDGHAIVGQTPGIPGFVQCVGFGGHGLMHSPAAGKAVAELVTTGRCTTFDLHPLRLARFEEGDLTIETAVL
jgi:sarcosine oxidase subunit beta